MGFPLKLITPIKLGLVVLVALIVAACNQAQEVKNPPRVKSGVIRLSDASIEYFSQGQGEVVILLSGRGLDVGYLEPLSMQLAAAGYQAIRINRRGAGKSTGSLESITYHSHAADVAAVVQALNLKSVTVLGHALGGRIAQTFAADHAKLTNSIIVMPTGGKLKGDPNEAKAMSQLFNPKATDAQIMEGMKFMVGDPSSSERVWKIIQPSSLANRPATLKSEATMNTPLAEWWAPPGDTPFLIVHGLKDRNSPIENSYMLKADLGNRATLVTLPGAGHLAPVEYPKEVAVSIISFLQ